MSARGVADVLFCLDISHSMGPCLDGLKTHLGDFLKGLKARGQSAWDLRVDYVAHCVGTSRQGEPMLHHRSACCDNLLEALYLQGGGRFFTSDLDEFRSSLDRLSCHGNEATLIALDFCLDFPWRPAAQCHRAVILLTDETFEDGVLCSEQTAVLPRLIRKLQDLRVMLFIVAPDSPTFQRLAEADKSEYEVSEGRQKGLADVDFGRVLEYIGKSVSISTLQSAEGKAERALFDQPTWRAGTGTFQGR